MINNIFYFKSINKIGGTENFLYEIEKKYNNFDIMIYYDKADANQLNRLRKYFRCKKRIPGEKLQCKKAFYNYDIDPINDIEADEHIFVAHGIYQILKVQPPINHPKITKIIGVSQYACDMIKDYINNDIEPIKCYDPLTLEKVKKPKILIAACRLDDEIKGGKRTLKLIEELDKYCMANPDEHYLFLIYSNPINFKIESPNVKLMQPRIDIKPFFTIADYIVQLSDDMETYCYTVNEALSYNIPVITTPLSVIKEFKLTDDMQITLNWDCSNIKEVVKDIFNKPKKDFKYKPPKPEWEKVLAKGKNTYKYESNKIVEVEAISFYTDIELKQDIVPGNTFKTRLERALYLQDNELIKIKE